MFYIISEQGQVFRILPGELDSFLIAYIFWKWVLYICQPICVCKGISFKSIFWSKNQNELFFLKYVVKMKKVLWQTFWGIISHLKYMIQLIQIEA